LANDVPAIHAVCGMVGSTCSALYRSYLSQFLQSIGYKYLTVTMNFGQITEMLVLFFVPTIIKRFGLRLTMIVGLAALLFRYVAFYYGTVSGLDWILFTGILVHGIIFGFFSLGGQVYIDKVAPPCLKAQAQGFIFLITFGIGILVGNFLGAWLIQLYTIVDNAGVNRVQWDKIWAISSIISFSVLLFFILFFNYKRESLNERISAGNR
jgi:hypothetical protein